MPSLRKATLAHGNVRIARRVLGLQAHAQAAAMDCDLRRDLSIFKEPGVWVSFGMMAAAGAVLAVSLWFVLG